MPFVFSGRTAVITGAASGIGRALALALADQGMKLVLADLDLATVEGLAEEIERQGGRTLASRTDVSDPEDVERLAELADKEFGGTDLLCNNAGIMTADRYRPVWEFTLAEWKAMIDVNLMGVVNGLRSFVPRMLAQRTAGHLLNTASAAGLITGAISVPYSVSKHGVVRISEGLFAALRKRRAPIGVTVLCPGLVRTAIYAASGNQPEDGAEGFVFDETTAEPEEIARIALQAISQHRLYALTTTAFDKAIEARATAILARRNPDL
ncbi:SDR family NAD(P)-dependent oxidoreductase [Sphingomonas tabacisoli]|uniref:SDR family NAD(P)-dependent oxidoreductase n=1 Tax=Sphingomonas tabacisoli TaxID=2249466 RepID=A0ABW4I1Y6_9SPHN